MALLNVNANSVELSSNCQLWQWVVQLNALFYTFYGAVSCTHRNRYFVLPILQKLLLNKVTADSIMLPLQLFGHIVIQQGVILKNIDFVSISVENY